MNTNDIFEDMIKTCERNIVHFKNCIQNIPSEQRYFNGEIKREQKSIKAYKEAIVNNDRKIV
jgi:hypothetical protein